MMFKTHLAFSFLCSLLTWPLFDDTGMKKWVYVVIFLFASFLPDIDTTSSSLGRHVKIVGWIFGHRGIFHSIWPLVFFFVSIYIFFGLFYALAFSFGYISHLILDMLNHQGVGLFFPLLKWRARGFCKSGGLFEKLVFLISLILIIAMTVM